MLDRYLLLEVVGTGGMGVVYSAFDPQLDRRVALKLFKVSAGGEGTNPLRARLLREAQAMARLTHPNVLPVFDVREADGRCFIAMELVEGVTLRRWLETDHSWRETLAVLMQAGRGLASAHQAGVVHRDFKPDNVLVGHDGRVRVSDFGLAAALHSEVPAPLLPTRLVSPISDVITRPGSVLGTPAYASPEQLDGATADARSDQFSFCVTLWEALFGTRPVLAQTARQRLHFKEARRLVTRGGGRVPRRLVRALLRGLSARPENRFESLDELLVELHGSAVAARKRWVFWWRRASWVWGWAHTSCTSGERACAKAPTRIWQRSGEPLKERHSRRSSRVQGGPMGPNSSPGETEEALALGQRALRLLEDSLAPGHPALAHPLRALGQTLHFAGRHGEAASFLQRTLALGKDGADTPALAVHTIALLGAALREQNQLVEALEQYRAAQSFAERDLGPEHGALAEVLTGAGLTHLALKQPQVAASILERALTIAERTEGPPERLADVRFALAQALRAAGGDRIHAAELAHKAQESLRESLRPDSGASRAIEALVGQPRCPTIEARDGIHLFDALW